MFATPDYTNGWLVYIAAAIGLLVVFWRMTRGIPWPYVRHSLWITVVVFLLTPAVGHAHFLAPAWIIGILELLFTGMESFLPMVRLLLIVLSLIHISEPTRPRLISYAVFCLKKKI